MSDSLAHRFATEACNDAWANQRLLAACARLSQEECAAPGFGEETVWGPFAFPVEGNARPAREKRGPSPFQSSGVDANAGSASARAE